ncbi:hypothetical protein [Glutamicibacter ardleyensis]|uniref:hypothetical protein n=1 Tax=Glutamicibacter ardleyensis TaxID=225894 RepID=UPI003FCF2D11
MLSQPCIDAMLHEIASGRNIAIIPESHKALTAIIRQLTDLLPVEIVDSVRMMNGQESITLTNGARILFPRQTRNLRGENLGLAIIQGRGMTEEDAFHLIPALDTTNGPILTRA